MQLPSLAFGLLVLASPGSPALEEDGCLVDALEVEPPLEDQQPAGSLGTYHPTLARALRRGDAAHALEMIVMPSFSPERAVWLERTEAGPRAVSIHLRAGLWHTAWHRGMEARRRWDPGRTFEEALEEVSRDPEVSTAPIHEEAADALGAVWSAALDAARTQGKCRLVMADGTTFHFAAWTAGRHRSGRLHMQYGPVVRELVALGNALDAFARAPEAERPALEDALRARSRALLGRFEADHGGGCGRAAAGALGAAALLGALGALEVRRRRRATSRKPSS